MRKSSLTLLLVLGAVVTLGGTPAWSQTDLQPVLESADQTMTAISKSRAGRLRTSAASDPDTVWIGHVVGNTGLPGVAGGYGPYRLGRGLHRPGKPTATIAERSGYWDFDTFNPGETDSLMGWWPLNRGIGTTGGAVVNDKERPFHGHDYGNQGNFVLNAGTSQQRTFGVTGYWHRDPGVNQPGLPDIGGVVPGPDVEWAPINGGFSAWCGLRGHNDLTVQDPITGNYYNQNVLDRMSSMAPTVLGGSISPAGTDRNFPGYGSCWDQMMYRDVTLTDGQALNVAFNYRTDMSTLVHTAPATRIGWFDKDPIKTATLNDGNFVSSTDAGANAPADSFMVYIGVPVEPLAGDDNDFKCSDPTAGANGDGMLEIFDVQRRWFSEVVAIDKPYRQLLSKAGVTPVTAFSVSLPNGVVQPLLDAQAGAGGRVRIVFRVKTNRGGDDSDLFQNNFSSGTAGAAIVDDVVVNSTTIGNFEGASSFDNNPATPATSAWKTTGKPPGVYFHLHNQSDGLVWNDNCGPPGAATRACHMLDNVISAGDHDQQEKLGGAFVSSTSGNFKDRHSLFGSPTINLKSNGVGQYNDMGIDTEIADASEYRLQFDIYTGGTKGNVNGNFFQLAWSVFPSRQANNLDIWGEIRTPPVISSFGFTACIQQISRNARTDANLVTTNANGIPDSVRVYIQHVNRCFALPLTAATCSPTTGPNAGIYFDNLAFALIDGEPPPSIAFNTWDLWQDAFPTNGTASLLTTPLGAGLAFDTTAAQVRQGLNHAQNTGAAINRLNIPGDSLVFTAGDVHRPPAAQGNQPTRVDLVFRILPGVGNYVQLGNKASGLKQSPAVATPAVSGDNSFWGQYLASNGQFGSPGGHPGGVWSQHVWNSARCDSAERNRFLSNGHSNNLHEQAAGLWMGTYHEDDPKFAVLGILKNRCFLQNNSAGAPNNASNINCGNGVVGNPGAVYPPVWTAAVGSGYSGSTQTREFTKIIPDGQLTPGAHVQYFVRKSIVGDLANFEVAPDTQKVAAQNSEGPNTDGHRWQQFGVLPDRWKAAEYGGQGTACMLFIDGQDRRGDERFWVSVMDSIGGTGVAKRGAHNGWSAPGDFDWSQSLPMSANNGGNPDVASQPWSVAAHGGQPGTTWDMFGVKASESGNTAGSIGNRSAGSGTPLGIAAGKTGNYGPTGDMLRHFYRVLFYASGDIGTNGAPTIGPYTNKTDNDVELLNDFANTTAGTPKPRGVWVMGRSFAESQSNPANNHNTWFVNYFAANTTGPGGARDYYTEVNPMNAPDLIPQAAIGGNGRIFGVVSTCLIDDDVLSINTGITGAVASSYYQNAGISTDPQEAGVFAPPGPGHDHISLIDAFRIQSIGSRYTLGRTGLLHYMLNTYNSVFGAVCPLIPGAPLGIGDGPSPFVSFLNLRSANPMRSGEAQIAFGIKSTEKVEVKVYDVTGRLVKTVANRTFQGGVEHVVTWDGTNDAGQSVARGVYFYQLRSPSFTSQKKLTVLKN